MQGCPSIAQNLPPVKLLYLRHAQRALPHQTTLPLADAPFSFQRPVRPPGFPLPLPPLLCHSDLRLGPVGLPHAQNTEFESDAALHLPAEVCLLYVNVYHGPSAMMGCELGLAVFYLFLQPDAPQESFYVLSKLVNGYHGSSRGTIFCDSELTERNHVPDHMLIICHMCQLHMKDEAGSQHSEANILSLTSLTFLSLSTASFNLVLALLSATLGVLCFMVKGDLTSVSSLSFLI
eukprot:g67945.t1